MASLPVNAWTDSLRGSLRLIDTKRVVGVTLPRAFRDRNGLLDFLGTERFQGVTNGRGHGLILG